MIEDYHFGVITVDGETYNRDVEIRWSSEILNWQRKESHQIDLEDVKRAISQSPEVIIIGTGESGVAEVTGQAEEAIKEKGIKLIIDITGQAVKSFNIIKGKAKVIGLFHLTC